MASVCGSPLRTLPVVGNFQPVLASKDGKQKRCSALKTTSVGNPFLGSRLVRHSASASTGLRSSVELGAQAVASEPKPKLASEVPPVAHPGAKDTYAVAENIKYHAEYSPTSVKFEVKAAYNATALSLRDSLIQRWNDTFQHFQKTFPKEAHYLSMEFLQGRALLNAVGNLGVTSSYAEALKKLGHELEAVAEAEPDAALGNGGLGRLAACFLDSMATTNMPAWGYGLRYKYGLFQQKIEKDGQKEFAERWLEMGHPWEIPRNDITYPIKFFGSVETGSDGKKKWVGGENVLVKAYDVPIPGYKTKNTISLRLWQTSVGAHDFDLAAFNEGKHEKAQLAHSNAEKICWVLYPGDESLEGKELRLKQQYTLCSASIQDILSRFKERTALAGKPLNWSDLPLKVALQMNDTHPTLSVPELQRILVDVEGLSWSEAWKITSATVAYTNHTVLPEALEKWPLNLLESLLPRHVEIIKQIDAEFIAALKATYKDDTEEEIERKIAATSVLSDYYPKKPATVLQTNGNATSKGETPEAPKAPPPPPPPKPMVRMANLSVIGGKAVNGVAAIHSEIVKDDVFNDFYKLWPDKFQNKTNGVTPRRWLSFCNPELSAVITKWLGSDDWVLDLDKLTGLRKFSDDKELQKEWLAAKMTRKAALAKYIKEKTGYVISPNALYDIQVKRIHEYKRQFLNILGIIYRYKKMKEMSPEERKKCVPRVCLFGGKAFATYVQAKRIVQLIVDVGATVNNDPEIGDLLKVIFVPDYNVSVAEMLIPASELSQHISTAGMEASGTSNMKFTMNGCVLIGTLDGANVEIREEVGEDNFFLFGAYAHEINGLRKERAEGKFVPDPRFEEVKEYIRSGVFGSTDYNPLLGSLEGNEGYGRGDYFLVGKDFPSYIEAQDEVDAAYKDQERWTKMSILNTAGSGKFSSDRTILQYASEIWDIKASPVP
eukprot:TRINITY_DN8984_c0_g1_i1.p1 TRINITY_DN8984_c0_g1~~TRINITY_DN8984_c0_g1_i1.p1  ORF type:complete len:945 (+),score=249.52 TRINITY_DN8984_c0_g1_i1:69-2903(+)